MAKTKEKKGEKFNDLIGRRRPILGALFLFFGIIFIIALFDYNPNQEVFFSNFFDRFSSSTNQTTFNLCGRMGATFSKAFIHFFGAATALIPIFLIWSGFLSFKRSAKILGGFFTALLMWVNIVATACLCALVNKFIDSDLVASAYFTFGWGGLVGSEIFSRTLFPALRFMGSFILLDAVFLLSLVFIFVEDPSKLFSEIWDILKKIPHYSLTLIKCSSDIILYIPKKILSKKSQDESLEIKEFNVPSDDKLLSPDGTQRVSFSNDDSTKKIQSDSSPKFELPKKNENLKISRLEEEKFTPPKKIKNKGAYIFPSIDLLRKPSTASAIPRQEFEMKMAEIVEKLRTFNIDVQPMDAIAGPVLTRYEVTPAAGIKISKIIGLENDLAMSLRAGKVRVVTGLGTVGIEVPNSTRQMVCMRDIIESKVYHETKTEIPIALGKDVTGKPIVLDLTKMPHALIAGSTGSGKSVCINSIIVSLLYHSTPDDVRLVMVDPKMVELQVYNSLPHMLVPVVTDPRKVPAALKWLIAEMMKRYAIFQKVGVRNIVGFNGKILKDKEEQEKAAELDSMMTPEERALSLETETEVEDDAGNVEIPKKKLPYIICFIDELADLMAVASKEVESSISRLAQLGRASGIHLIVATQRPSVNVVTGLIKANLPTRIAFKVTSVTDSRTILDAKGSESLIGLGDMLFIPPGSPDLFRAQGAFVSDEEINAIVEALKINGEPEIEQSMQDKLDSAGIEDDDENTIDTEGEFEDDLMPQAMQVIKTTGKASISSLQTKMRIGYNRAARIISILEDKGMIGPDAGPGKQREINF